MTCRGCSFFVSCKPALLIKSGSLLARKLSATAKARRFYGNGTLSSLLAAIAFLFFYIAYRNLARNRTFLTRVGYDTHISIVLYYVYPIKMVFKQL